MSEATMDPAQLFESRLFSCHISMHAATESGKSEVQKFYDGTTIFITGSSGFLGKQMIEKLLRATNVSKIFILMRPKKGKSIKERSTEMLQDPLYNLLRNKRPEFEQKLVPITGDIGELRLGMSNEDWKIVTEETEVIFHMAATTRFNEVLRVATMINVRGTREMLLLATECRKLRSFIHVSTAYSHTTTDMINNKLAEKFYPSPVDPEILIRLVESDQETMVNNINNEFVKRWPNTYSFTKAVAEELVRLKGKHLPICILRPAIVICALREPNPGWLDLSCIYGATGIILQCGLGILHVLHINKDAEADLIPVDYVNNAAIVLALETAKRGDEKVKIYNMVAAGNKILWGQIIDAFYRMSSKYSFPDSIWYRFVISTANPVLFFVYNMMFHTIPSYLIDGVLLLLRKKMFAVKQSKKMYTLLKGVSFIITHSWKFENNNIVELYGKLSATDQEIFKFDVMNIIWNDYITSWGIGTRKYILKDGLTRTDYGRKKQIIFGILMFFLVGPMYFYMLYKVVYFISGRVSLVLKMLLNISFIVYRCA